jgi:hypothetical protein
MDGVRSSREAEKGLEPETPGNKRTGMARAFGSSPPSLNSKHKENEMPNVEGFTAAQMSVIDAMIAAAITEAVTTTVATMSAAPAAAVAQGPAAKLTLAEAKARSWTERLHRAAVKTTTVLNNGAGIAGDWTADKLSEVEVKTVPAIVSSTGYVCAKSAVAASTIGTKLSAWADRLAAARGAMEFANS